MKPLHKLIACILTSFVIPAVAPSAQQVPAQLKIAVAYAPKTLDAAIATDAAAARLLQLSHPTLLKWNETYQPTGLAAESCQQSTPAQVTCTLPTGRTYTDGTAFNSLTLKQWFTSLQGSARSPFASQLKGVDIQTPDMQTVIFNLPQPTLTFLATLAEIPVANPKNPAVGLGPYTLGKPDTIGNVTASTIRADLPQQLTFLFVPDATTRMLKLKKGEVDIVLNDLTPDIYQWAATNGFTTLSAPSTSYSYLGLNMQNSNLRQAAVRQAIALSLNRPAIRKYLLGNLADPALTILPPRHPAAWAAPEEAYDPDSAETILDEIPLIAGSDSPRFNITLLTSTDGFAQRVAQVIQSQLKEVGIGVTLRPTEFASFYDAVKKGQFDAVLLTWTGEQQPAFYNSLFNSKQTPPTGFNRTRFSDATVDNLTNQIMAAPTLEQQNQIAIQLQKVLADARPYVPLFRRHNTLVAKPNVMGCTLPPSGSYTGLASCRLK